MSNYTTIVDCVGVLMLVSSVACFEVQGVELLRFRGALVRECARAGIEVEELSVRDGLLRVRFVEEVDSFERMEGKVVRVLDAIAPRRESAAYDGNGTERFFGRGVLVRVHSSTRELRLT